ncbi:MAG: ABC transporter permease [Acidobacteriota bacterium]|nr:ABC transporter permease [Acidobacteriota bacterium]MDH3784156.1 ABC transporter permease [Acidobacteriota bacterium]
MHFLEYLRTAGGNLVRQKLRSLLTMLGMIFGVGAVISMLSIGAGAQAEALEMIDAMGLRNILIREKAVDNEDLFTIRERSQGLKRTDIDNMRMVARDITLASAQKRIRVDRVLSPHGRSEGAVLGVGRNYFELSNLSISRGTLFDADESDGFQRVCVLGDRAREELFAFEDPIGRPVKISDTWFTVVGLLAPQILAKDSFQGVDLDSADNSVFIPISTALKMYELSTLSSELDEIVLQVAHGASIESTTRIIDEVLEDLHGGERDFTIIVPQDLLDQSRRTRRIFNIVMGGIAGISLLVGGIGIMNIMMASVLERTREIGVRRAIGARRRDILSQFLFEAVLISLLGGMLGVILGISIAQGVSALSDWSTVVTGFSILLSFSFSVTVGIVFGTYPAVNAARLNPIDALGYE